MKRVLILGFYKKHNLGDDLFEYILTKWLPDTECIFSDPHDLKELPENLSCVCIGGGDLINDYFMDTIRNLLKDYKGPVYGIGLGVPYPKLLTASYLDIFDFINIRTSSSFDKLKSIMPDRCACGPDIVRALTNEVAKERSTSDISNFQNSSSSLSAAPTVNTRGLFGTKKIGVFLAKPMISNREENREVVFNKIVSLLKNIAEIGGPSWLAMKTYDLYLYSMNTSGTNEDDSLLTREIYERLKGYRNVHLITSEIKPDEVLSLFKSFYATICTRFHAHILSLNAGTPIFSLYSCEKVRDLIVSEGLEEYAEKMIINPQTLAPTDFNLDSAITKFNNLIHHYDFVVEKLKTKVDITPTKMCILNLIYYLPKFRKYDIEGAIASVQKYMGVSDLDACILTPENASYLAKAITFTLTRNENAPFSWGLEQNLARGNAPGKIVDSIKWIVENCNIKKNTNYLNSTIPFPLRKYNFEYLGTEQQSGIHRFGWSGIVNELQKYHNPDGVIFDHYCDRTFGWHREHLAKLGLIPYRKKWTGVFHHTGDESYDKNNLTECIKTKEFLESLEYCESIIVLSQYLKDWLKKNLKYRVKIRVVYHPMPEFEKKWTYDNWKKNPDKKLIQIGSFLRNTYAIFALPKPKRMRKCAIRGKNMDNYFPKENFLEELHLNIPHVECDSNTICRHRTNKFMTGLCDDIRRQIESVEIIREVSNEEYDNLITSNVIFINLFNASACNTILEAIRCTTPIAVNPLPAVVEYLGKDYPLYYNTFEEAIDLLNNERKIIEAHVYLKRKDKTFINMDTFLEAVMNPNIKRKFEHRSIDLNDLNDLNESEIKEHEEELEEVREKKIKV